ncbi:glycosyltransferase [Rheinheimera baltica]|uniref:glycosyltransferase n=1 Tax=Rheinheimera baltica TaxID=67576 RepID=UPI00273F17B4|nr:glycosyltransferase [Rheinheimera baltica]MDP5189399.1 glycosyltransferase [Rheinheimera baltica]
MALKKNIIANYLGTGYNLLIGIVILPLYLGYMGAEAYGLVGFFTLMQVWLNILDLGLSQTLNRQAAAASATPSGYAHFMSVLKSFELIFFGLALITVAVVFSGSAWMAEHWFEAKVLSSDDICHALQLMGIIIALRWQTALYRSGILGFEYHVWNNLVSVGYASFRFIGSLLLVVFVSNDILHFFYYQLLLAVLEFIVLRLKLYAILPGNLDRRWRFDLLAVRKVAPFALGVAYSAALWVAVTQLDKLMLSTLLPLQQFGYFSLVTVICSGLLHITYPVSVAIQPRLTALVSQGKIAEMHLLYRRATRFVAVMSGAVVVVMVVYAEPLLFAWTGDKAAAAWGAPVLVWFALGNAMLTLGTFQYFLQFAFGSMRLHVVGSTIAAVLQVPIIFYAAVNYGAVGAGLAWFGFRGLFFMVWPPIVHHRFAPGLHWRWLLTDVLPAILSTAALILLLQKWWPVAMDNSRFNLILHIAFISLVTLILMLTIGFISEYWRKTGRLPVMPSGVPTEAEIVSQWSDQEPTVSICCITYNQASYIQQTLDGFLRQKTGFAFEILVHDDASTDGTSDIIRQYAARYPSLIRAVLQTDNQFSQGKQVSPNFVWPLAKGRYIALCEGDDFWFNENKLSRQVTALDNASDADICFHPSIDLFPDATQLQACYLGSKANRVSYADVIRGGGGYMPTASILIRSAVLKHLPNWFSSAPVGDYYLQMLGAQKGGAVYLPHAMCCYRRKAENSWTLSTKGWTQQHVVKVAQAHIHVLSQLCLTSATNHVADFDYAKSRELMLAAIMAVRSSHFSTAKTLIEQSWQCYRFAGWRQPVLYLARHNLNVLLKAKSLFNVPKPEVADE